MNPPYVQGSSTTHTLKLKITFKSNQQEPLILKHDDTSFMAFYQEIKYCIVPDPTLIGDGTCQNYGKYNTAGCFFDGGDCIAFNKKYPDCDARYPKLLGDDRCDGGAYNTPECEFDGGDCLEFNTIFPNCSVEYPFRIGNENCDGGNYDTIECGYDGSDCLDWWERHPECKVDNLDSIGDGVCDTNAYNNIECEYDKGDCDAFNDKYPNCTVPNPSKIGDGICNGVPYNTEECNYDEGDCAAFNEEFPDCAVDHPQNIGNGICDSPHYNNIQCSFDGGDCIEHNQKYPGCAADFPGSIGNGICNGGLYNTVECKFDEGDCINFNLKYPECIVDDPWKIGDGKCNSVPYNSAPCGFDGGDCIEFNVKYPRCVVPDPEKINNGICNGDEYNSQECSWDGSDCSEYLDFFTEYPDCGIDDPWMMGDGFCVGAPYNTAECGYEGGDCIAFNMRFPYCKIDKPSMIGDGYCFGGPYDTEECGYEGGDCDAFKTQYPDCTAEYPSRIGDGRCDGGVYNSKECNFDNNDCAEFDQKYPGCAVQSPSWIGDGNCDGGLYNTLECSFDGGDCDEFNEKYPNCYGVEIKELGDGVCQHNSQGCNFDNGDCAFFTDLYPDCTAERPHDIGNFICNEELNTAECKYDGGDCIRGETSILIINGESVSVEAYQNDTKTYVIFQMASSILSLISSIGIIWIIQRSFIKLTVPFHRLLLGLCIADILLSLALSFSTMPAPGSFEEIWNAHGNKASCRVQGFFIFLGSLAAPLYTCSMCIYYLIMVTYRKGKDADKFVKGRIEFFLHAVPISVSLIGALTILSMDAFHPNMTYCFIGADPTCDYLDCERRHAYAKVLFVIFSAGPYFGLPCVIMSTMFLMFRSVWRQEKKLQKFGVGALSQKVLCKTKHDQKVGKGVASMNPFVLYNACISSRRQQRTLSRSNSATKQSRAVTNKALSYSLAFFLTYLFPIIISVRTLSGLESGPVLSTLARILFPLQGFFNFIVFIHPKVIFAKESGRTGISWYRAFMRAIQSRGRKRKGRLSVKSNVTGSSLLTTRGTFAKNVFSPRCFKNERTRDTTTTDGDRADPQNKKAKMVDEKYPPSRPLRSPCKSSFSTTITPSGPGSRRSIDNMGSLGLPSSTLTSSPSSRRSMIIEDCLVHTGTHPPSHISALDNHRSIDTSGSLVRYPSSNQTSPPSSRRSMIIVDTNPMALIPVLGNGCLNDIEGGLHPDHNGDAASTIWTD